MCASLDCVLKILDDPVTVDERVNAWGASSHMLSAEGDGDAGADFGERGRRTGKMNVAIHGAVPQLGRISCSEWCVNAS